MTRESNVVYGLFDDQSFLRRPESELQALIETSVMLGEFAPEILTRIDADRDRKAKQDALLRRRDEEWHLAQSSGRLPGELSEDIEGAERPLGNGPRRLSAQTVLTLMFVRGWLGGFKSQHSRNFLAESQSLFVLARSEGRLALPPSTCIDAVNPITPETREFILRQELRLAKELKLDDYGKMLGDSTAVESHSQFPTDSNTLAALCARIIGAFSFLSRKYEITVTIGKRVHDWLEETEKLATAIALLPKGTRKSKRERKRLYKKLLKRVKNLLGYGRSAVSRLQPLIDSKAFPPSVFARIECVSVGIANDLDLIAKSIAATEKRVVDEDSPKAEEKVFSTSDEDAWMIVKGGRVPVLGYKPQIASSLTSGLITAILVEKGNPKDSKKMLELVDAHLANTGVDSVDVSFDSGYASISGIKSLLGNEKVASASVAGSLARDVLGEEIYDSEEYKDLRKSRSRVEGTIGHLKDSFGFGECSRVGLESVKAEMMEKVLSFNIRRIALLTSRNAQAA